MALTLGDNFSYQGAKPLDSRIQFATVAAMKAYAEASLYNGCFAYITENKKYYTYDSSNTVDSTTGKWREFESGGAGASALEDLTDVDVTSPTSGNILKYDGSKWANAQFVIDMNPTSSSLNPVSSGGVFDGLATKYDPSDTAETDIDDADYFPFYDTSATAKRKSLWSNIKSVLKTYFDTIYSTVNSKLTPASGGMDLSLVTTGDMYSWNLSVPTVMSATLSSGSTSVTFSDVPTSGNKVISILTSKIGLEYDSVSQSGSTVTVTFPSQSSSVTVYLKIENV